jgi:dimethylamine monooxygenase subunit A
MQSGKNAVVDGPLYRPYRWAAADFQLGLRPIRPENWILIGAGHAEMMRQKCERLANQRQCYYRTLPTSLPAQRELRERIVAHLAADHPQSFEKIGSVVRSLITRQTLDLDDASTEPLMQVSYLIEEDFMLLEEIEGTIQITAASNAYSSSGRLVGSVGHDVEWAHEPVPQLTRKLGGKINRVLGSIHADTPCERFNWQITPMATVFFPHDDPHAANAAAMREVLVELRRDPARAGEFLWIRVERQTLMRLPDSNAVAFSLHTYSDPLSSMQSDVESVRAIWTLLNNYSEERWKYSEMDIVREPLMTWLDAAARWHG